MPGGTRHYPVESSNIQTNCFRVTKLDSGPAIASDYTPLPVSDNGGGWGDEIVVRDGQQMARFTSVRSWLCAGAATAWYKDFVSQVMQGGYERLGLKVDALRLSATGGAESTFLTLFDPVKRMDWFPRSLPSQN